VSIVLLVMTLVLLFVANGDFDFSLAVIP
jgi:uncharacterized membrane protein